MATTVIQNSALCGANAGILFQRVTSRLSPNGPVAPTVADYASAAAAAAAIAAEVVVANAALAVPMTDADNAQIGPLVQSVTQSILSGQPLNSPAAVDYAAIAAVIANACKAGVAGLI